MLRNKKHELFNFQRTLFSSVKKSMVLEKQKNLFRKNILEKLMKSRFSSEKWKLNLIENKNTGHNPAELFKRGYSFVRKNGKPVKSALDLQKDDTIENIFSDGRVHSRVINKNE
ncbi:MAG: hypothetical protein HC906_10505 [Bacteroidales bacterium]|nr:hypothetical protein [Bacteroidales bacterium]